jgi:hypothetical protein
MNMKNRSSIILTFDYQIQKQFKQIIVVKTHVDKITDARNAVLKRMRSYKIEYRHRIYEIICPEYIDENCNSTLIIPDFLIPGRKYPVCVYIYAIHLYCSNKWMGQREAARLTKEKFGLASFSHTTLGRTAKVLEQSLLVGTGGDVEDKCRPQKGFPTVSDTAARRKLITKFLGKFNMSDKDITIKASRAVVAHWYGKHRRLLI